MVSESKSRPREAIVFDFDQYRKLILSKAVCMDHSIMELCFLEGIYKEFLPFLNAVLIPPRKDTENPVVLHETKTKYKFHKELVVKWDQRFPSVSTYMISPCRGMKMIDIDIDDTTYCDKDTLENFLAFVETLEMCNQNNKIIDRASLKECYGVIKEIGDAIYETMSITLDVSKENIYYTGRGFQVWTQYKTDVIRNLMDKNMICSSNDENRKAQRLFSPLFMGIEKMNKSHMQCCVPYNDWNRFKFSNPAYYKIPKPELRTAAMEYNNALMVSRMRHGERDYMKWFDMMQRKQVEQEKNIFKLLKVDINPIVT